MVTRKQLSGIDKALNEGLELRAFRSGGGLRVIRIEDKNENLKGYGEHPHLMQAMLYAAKDYIQGGKPYKEVYNNVVRLHYLTGSRSADDALDAFVLNGHKIYAKKGEKGIELSLVNGSEYNKEKPIKMKNAKNFREAYITLDKVLSEVEKLDKLIRALERFKEQK